MNFCDELVFKANSKLGQFMRTCHFTRYRGQKTKNNFFFNKSKIEFLTLLYYIWHPQSSNQLAKFEAIQRRATIWIYGRKFDHYKYMNMLINSNSLTNKVKVFPKLLNFDLVNSLVSIQLPDRV